MFRDGLIDASLSRTADLQQAYENRIANLRGEIDRIASRQLLDQVAYDQKIERLLSRQAELTDSQKMLGSLLETAKGQGLDVGPVDPTITGSLPAAPARTTATARLTPSARLDAPDVANAYASPAPAGTAGASFDALLDGERDEPATPKLRGAAAEVEPAERPNLAAMADQLQTLKSQQYTAIAAIAAAAETKTEKARSIMRSVGINLKVAKTETASTADTGGPYIPLGSAQQFADAVGRAQTAIEQLGRVRKATATLPLEDPLTGATMTSTFGSRSDPFLGRLAMHSGVDYRSPTGRDVPASAPGKVVFAGRSGGYGNLVEIDHGKGLTTRYAHLSSISARVGEKVAKGEKIGEVGSTGRSTGPHLHYETRVNGVAVDPQIYLAAGRRLERLFGG
ncbi:M23 family metallopeptidase [Methylobrevis pamukkalensis]|uniref:Murein DD-endopeptidase MepM n=1 Tax=Methylobrevis pamukkalensis TaxID=1439726 RepID=A0A1E3H0A9_9HYPH|nr:M23 family metallopeptidase [Methylobrevis pamukkalensis]ODN69778.1 Murein DD-endopeptidase MepM [Methylobrevis pamukkalensis]